VAAVGPNFKTPDAPKVTGYLAEPAPPQAGTDAQHYVAGMDIHGQWWTLFHSTALNELVQQSLKSNPTLQAAQATLREANENVAAQRGTLSPRSRRAMTSVAIATRPVRCSRH